MARRSTLLPLKKEKYISTKWTRTHFHPRSKRYRSRKFSTASSFFPGGILTSNRAYGSRSTSSLPGFLRRRRNQRAYLRYINGTRSSSDVRGANKEERVLSAINRHQPAIIIDTRCPHNESIYTDVYRYTILSPVRLSRDYAAANLPSPPASSFFLLPFLLRRFDLVFSLSLSSPLLLSAKGLFTKRNVFKLFRRQISFERERI